MYLAADDLARERRLELARLSAADAAARRVRRARRAARTAARTVGHAAEEASPPARPWTWVGMAPLRRTVTLLRCKLEG